MAEIQETNRMFTSPDPSSNSAISYDVYAHPHYASVSVRINDESVFYLDLVDKSAGDYVKAFDDLISFLQEAKQAALAVEKAQRDSDD